MVAPPKGRWQFMLIVQFLSVLLSFAVAVPGASGQSLTSPKPAANTPTVQLTSLRIMREKGIITQAEYESAMRDMGDSVGAAAGDATTVMVGKWATTMY